MTPGGADVRTANARHDGEDGSFGQRGRKTKANAGKGQKKKCHATYEHSLQ